MADGRFLVGKPSGGVTTVTVADGATDTNLVLPESGTVANELYVNNTVSLATSGFPAFYAYSTSSQSFTGSVWAKLVCNAELYDTTGAYDKATNFRFIPQKAGKYRVTIQMQSVSANTGGGIAIYKNGSLYAKLQALNGTTICDTFTGSYTLYLNGTTDFIEAYGIWNSNNSAVSGFSAEYIVGV